LIDATRAQADGDVRVEERLSPNRSRPPRTAETLEAV
jgi:hypothetical protein